MVVYIYNPSYSGGSWFKTSLNKKFVSPPISTNKPGMVVHICNPSYAGDIGKRIMV
jgi:hypothetical protein